MHFDSITDYLNNGGESQKTVTKCCNYILCALRHFYYFYQKKATNLVAFLCNRSIT